MEMECCELGMVGLGVMGRNLLLNMAEHGHAVSGFDKDSDKVAALREASGSRPVRATTDIRSLAGQLRRPRTVMLLVPAGSIVDDVITELRSFLEADDLIIDGGNSRFTDTDRRASELESHGIHYIGLGVSGGEHGARHGPSLMPGGARPAYARVQSLFEDVAARAGGEPCVAFLGPRSAGHYVKMVHNGIEYGVMQLIAETCDIMKRGLRLGNDDLQAVYRKWNETEVSGFLIEITGDIFGRPDERTGGRLIDVVRDRARQKGTGMWTSQEALELQSPTPTIDAAVTARDLSALGGLRPEVSGRYASASPRFPGHAQEWIERLRSALYAAMVLTYSQGLSLLRAASDRYGYGLSLEHVARIWRGGCIIRAALLEDVRAAYHAAPDLSSLLVNDRLGRQVAERQEALAQVVGAAARGGIPAPAFMASLAYFDGLRSERLPAYLIQAQRDYFGSHTYERIDGEGTFHTRWTED